MRRMERKQCLAYILALCILLSLVPVFSASASTLAPGQIIPDGIYYIKNKYSNYYMIICEGCKADIIKNRHRFIDYASSSTVRGT